MSKKKTNFKIEKVLDEIPEKWTLRRRKAYLTYEIQKIVEIIGIDQINISRLAKKYHFEWHTVNKLYTKIVQSVPREQIDLIASKAEIRINKAFQRLGRITADPQVGVADKIAAEREIRGYINSQIKVLEAYGRKAPTPEQLVIKKDVSLGELYEKYHGKRKEDPGRSDKK